MCLTFRTSQDSSSVLAFGPNASGISYFMDRENIFTHRRVLKIQRDTGQINGLTSVRSSEIVDSERFDPPSPKKGTTWNDQVTGSRNPSSFAPRHFEGPGSVLHFAPGPADSKQGAHVPSRPQQPAIICAPSTRPRPIVTHAPNPVGHVAIRTLRGRGSSQRCQRRRARWRWQRRRAR